MIIQADILPWCSMKYPVYHKTRANRPTGRNAWKETLTCDSRMSKTYPTIGWRTKYYQARYQADHSWFTVSYWSGMFSSIKYHIRYAICSAGIYVSLECATNSWERQKSCKRFLAMFPTDMSEEDLKKAMLDMPLNQMKSVVKKRSKLQTQGDASILHASNACKSKK